MNLYIYVNFSLVLKTLKNYMYNEKTNAQLIDSFIILFFIYRSYMFQRQRVILRELLVGAC